LLAMIDLHLALRLIDLAHVEDPLEEELLRTLAEVFQPCGGDGFEHLREPLARTDVAVEFAARAGAGEELERALRVARCELRRRSSRAAAPQYLGSRNPQPSQELRASQHLAEPVAPRVAEPHGSARGIEEQLKQVLLLRP